jgi:hypothetical protein
MKKVVWVVLMLVFVCTSSFAEKKKGGYLIILHSGNETNEGLSRATHALLYAEELAEGGYNVVLVFDGAGTGWATAFQDPNHPLHERFLKILQVGVVEKICDHCAESNGVKDQLSERQRNLLVNEYNGHSSIVKWIDKGYRVIVM